MTTKDKAPKVPPLALSEVNGEPAVSCDAGRIKLDACPVRFSGRDEFKEWHEWDSATETGANVRRQFHRARVSFSYYDEEDSRGRREEHSRATVNGIPLVGYACAVYRLCWQGRDADGNDLPRAWEWDYDWQASYVRRAGSAFAAELPAGAAETVRRLACAAITLCSTPERLRVAEAKRLERIAAQQRERADELIQSAQECRERASALYTMAAESNGTPEPCDESEPERIIRQARR